MSRDVQLVIAWHPQSGFDGNWSKRGRLWQTNRIRSGIAMHAPVMDLQLSQQWRVTQRRVTAALVKLRDRQRVAKKLSATIPDCLFAQHIFKFNNTKCTRKHVAMLIGAKRFPLAELLSSLYGHLKSLIDRKTIASFLPFSFRLFRTFLHGMMIASNSWLNSQTHRLSLPTSACVKSEDDSLNSR